jgi:hypothetical protein
VLTQKPTLLTDLYENCVDDNRRFYYSGIDINLYLFDWGTAFVRRKLTV